MKPKENRTRLPSRELLKRFFLAPSDDRANPLQSVFSMGTAEIWRLGQQRRSQCLAAWLGQKRSGDPSTES